MHPCVGDKYKVWPLLDFQSAIEDYKQGITHIIRGKDLMDSTRKQKLLYEHFGWKYPETLYWGRVKVFEFGSFSTSGMKNSITLEEYSGWDDIRLPTIKSFKEEVLILIHSMIFGSIWDSHKRIYLFQCKQLNHLISRK